MKFAALFRQANSTAIYGEAVTVKVTADQAISLYTALCRQCRIHEKEVARHPVGSRPYDLGARNFQRTSDLRALVQIHLMDVLATYGVDIDDPSLNRSAKSSRSSGVSNINTRE